jgi:hypothetical protein
MLVLRWDCLVGCNGGEKKYKTTWVQYSKPLFLQPVWENSTETQMERQIPQ